MRSTIDEPRGRVAAAGLAVAVLLAPAGEALALPPANGPQLLMVITNSQSMAGTTSGAIMLGSGALQASLPPDFATPASLRSSSSPTHYRVPDGFTPPLLSPNATNSAPYTVYCGPGQIYQCDHGPSRLNLAKGAIKSVMDTYKAKVNFGLYSYDFMTYPDGLGGTTPQYVFNATWTYYMSPPEGNFTLTDTPGPNTIPNPCYNFYSASDTAAGNCYPIESTHFPGQGLNTKKYITVGQSADESSINDVMYIGYGLDRRPSVVVSYGGPTPQEPYKKYTLEDFRTRLAKFVVLYNTSTPTSPFTGYSPTNAGFVPSSPKVLLARRGWSSRGAESATTGRVSVPMGTDPDSAAFTSALAMETSSPGTGEIKAAAFQSPIAGLLTGARDYLKTLTPVGSTTCSANQRAVLLLTDGLPTKDMTGGNWPPLGSQAANAFNLTASFNADGSLQATGSQALIDTIDAITALKEDGVKTYVIGLGAGVDASSNPTAAKVLKAMAVAGGSDEPLPANNAVALNEAMNAVVDAVSQPIGNSALAVPAAPLSLTDGNGYVYQVTSDEKPIKGHVFGVRVNADGSPKENTTPWDAGAGMTIARRNNYLFAAKAATGLGAVDKLSEVDSAAFQLTATTCVPDTAAVVAYTVDPSAKPVHTCDYLAGRAPGWLLGGITRKNSIKYVGPPGSATLSAKHSSYRTYAYDMRNRSPGLLYTSNDGFLYASNPTNGELYWGWTSQSLLSKMQNYATFQTLGSTHGGFTVVDAWNSSSKAWGSYVVGSFQSGAEHFSLKLQDNGLPDTVVFDSVVAGGQSPGDAPGEVGTVPSRQPPVIRYASDGSAYYLYVVNASGASTLHMVNVATGTDTTFSLGFTASSTLFWDATRSALWLGANDGKVYTITLVGPHFFKEEAFTTTRPADGASAGPVLYVSYAEVENVPYAIALGSDLMSVYHITSDGWTPLWATTRTQGYTYSHTPPAGFVANSNVAKLVTSSVVSDQPLIVGRDILVPLTVVSSSSCSTLGYYSFFSIGGGGAIPSTRLKLTDGTAITGPISFSGIAYTPALSSTSKGTHLFPPAPTDGSTTDNSLVYKGQPRTSSWRQR